MKKRLFSTIIIFASTLFLSCFGEINPTEIQQNFSQYPLKIGNSWQYEQESQYFNLRPDSISKYFPTTIRKFSITTSIPREERLMDSIDTYVINEQVSLAGPVVRYAEKYYTNHPEGFLLHAYLGMSSILPKNGFPTLRFKSKSYLDIDQLLNEITLKLQYLVNSVPDSVYFAMPPLLVLPYPLQIGQSWKIREFGDPFLLVKKMVGRETITTGAGRFTTDVIQWLYDFDGNGQWDEDIIFMDYYSAIGLVKRSLTVQNLALVDQSGHAIGYVDYSEISELQTYTVR